MKFNIRSVENRAREKEPPSHMYVCVYSFSLALFSTLRILNFIIKTFITLL